MAHAHEKTRMQKFTEGLSKFLNKNWKAIIIVIGAGIILLGVLGIVSQVNSGKIDASAEKLGEFEKTYEENWLASEEEDKTETAETLKVIAEEIFSEYEGSYAAQKAMMIMGGIEFELENWESAAGYYMDAADTNSSSFFAPVALMYSAAAYEESGNLEKSRDIYLMVIENYAGQPQEALRARFNAGRIEELLGNNEKAVEQYNLLVDEDPQDPWAMLAQSRLLYISE